MEYRELGHTSEKVSLIGLGTMTWGEQNSAAEAHVQLDTAVAAGVTLIDTAEMYPVPPRDTTQGQTETILGDWLKKSGRRNELFIATKATSRADWVPWIRGGPRLDRRSIIEACEGSLKRLGIDCIDLYQIHWPERSTNYFGQLDYPYQDDGDAVSIHETLRALDELRKAGKIRHIGISNETPWGVAEYLRLSHTEGLPRLASIQNPYNLLNRSFEVGLAEFSHRESVSLLAYSPLAFGVLSGKYLDGARPDGARLTLYKRFARYTNPQASAATKAYTNIAKEAGLDPAQMALAFVNQQPFVGSNLIGATSLQQLQSNLASAQLQLSPDVREALQKVHTLYPNPAP